MIPIKGIWTKDQFMYIISNLTINVSQKLPGASTNLYLPVLISYPKRLRNERAFTILSVKYTSSEIRFYVFSEFTIL